MFQNYLKIAIRNLLRNKSFSAINISGLAIGMASALLILLWIQNELSYDRTYPKTDRLYIMYNRDKFEGKLWAWNNTPSPLATTLKNDYAAVEDVARYFNVTFLTSVGETRINSRGAFCDSSFLRLFQFPMLAGNADQALAGPKGIVLTEPMAKKLFGAQDAMGKTVRIDSNADFTVTGILKDLPPNTSFSFDYLVPFSFAVSIGWEKDQSNWGNNHLYTYVLLKPNASQAAFDQQVKRITIDHSKGNETTEVFTQPMSRNHLYATSDNGKLVGGRIKTVRLFGVIAGFILLIACINFMNLSTARSEKRAREVGVRKVVGAYRGFLIAQFIGESILIAGLAFIFAIALASLTLESFNLLVGKHLAIDYSNPTLWIFALGFILFTGLLAGSYPAFYLSSFQPVKVLKGTFKKVDALVSTRKVLVVLQFTFAIILIISTLIIQQQIQYAQDRDAGYDRHNLVYTFTQGDATKNYELIKSELLRSGAAIAVTKTSGPITQHWSDGWGYDWPGSTEADKKTDFIAFGEDAGFVKTMGAKLIGGRDVDIYKYPTDSTAVLLNEAAVKAMHIKNPIGMTFGRGDRDKYREDWHVVGVIKDFILESPYAEHIAPMIIAGPKYFCQVIHFKLNPANSISTNIAKAEKIFKQYNPKYPFEAIFTDEAYARKFKEEQQVGTLSALFAGLTIFISCLGLFALAAYMAENRLREIGVRKVLGASVTSITTLLAKDFVWLVGISFVIAAPIAWYAMEKWLDGYGYRISIGWSVFALSGILAMIIAVATVSYQAIRAALSNPVKSLRSE
ncbi:MAG: ABC transporter permease [Bacteroidetes bacterium]|nr:ABC transporter permease [Bacteroidota bacterium]